MLVGLLFGTALGAQVGSLGDYQLVGWVVRPVDCNCWQPQSHQLLLQVWRWCINGICQMVLCDMMLFDVAATLGGGVVATLLLGAPTLGIGRIDDGGVDHCPDMIAVSW